MIGFAVLGLLTCAVLAAAAAVIAARYDADETDLDGPFHYAITDTRPWPGPE